MDKMFSTYLGSSCNRDYPDSVSHVIGRAEYVYAKGYCDEELGIIAHLDEINKKGEKSLYYMRGIGTYYAAKASYDLLLLSNITLFKQDAYIAAKLHILGGDESLSWATGYNTSCFFLPIMSDNGDLINFLIQHKNDFKGEYKRTDTYSFFLKNTLLALAGDWELLKERAELFLNEPKKQKKDEKRIPDHEFYLGLCNQSVEQMQAALNKLLEPKLAKRAVYDNNVWFDFYLQMQVLMYAKIAAIHGFDLNIDSPIAPKELIEYKPLDKYEDPYDFMKEFDYNKPLQNWIDMWQERMHIAKEQEAKKKKGFFSWFKK